VQYRAIDAGLVHAVERVLDQIGAVLMLHTGDAFAPEMHLSIDDAHVFTRHCRSGDWLT